MGAQPVTTILWAAMLAAQPIFLVVGFLHEAARPAEDLTVVYAICGAAVMDGALSFFFRISLMRTALRTIEVEIDEAPDPHAESMFRDQAPTRRVFLHPKRLLGQIDRASQTPIILSLALATSVGVMGLVTRFLGAEPTFQFVFAGGAVLLMLLHFPTRARPIGMLEQMHDAAFVDEP